MSTMANSKLDVFRFDVLDFSIPGNDEVRA